MKKFLVPVVVLILFLLTAFVYFQANSCEYSLRDSIKSPNGEYVINNVIAYCGSRDPSQHLYLKKLSEHDDLSSSDDFGDFMASYPLRSVLSTSQETDGSFTSRQSFPNIFFASWKDDFNIEVDCEGGWGYGMNDGEKNQIDRIEINYEHSCDSFIIGLVPIL